MASAEHATPTRPGCPRIATQDPSQLVCIESVGNSVSLLIPNRLLFQWYQENTVYASHYLPLLNASIANKVVQVKVDSDEVGQQLCQRAGSVCRYSRKKAGRGRMEFLKRNSKIAVSSNHVVQVSHLQEEIVQLEQHVAELNCDVSLVKEELQICREAVEHMSSQLSRVIVEARQTCEHWKEICRCWYKATETEAGPF